MSLTANSAGAITGKFTVPAGIPTGTKLVQFIGDNGGYGDTTYTSKGNINIQERRRVTTINEIYQEQTTVVTQSYDPLAQTFILEQDRHIAGVDLWFTVKGKSKVVVQIRETTAGMPNRNVLAWAHIMPDDINVNGTHTRIDWSPVWLEAGTEYAIVVLTDDADTAVKIAQIGKYDKAKKEWVTSQPYQVGVLLSSSNASTWTPHQNRDLTFRLLAAKFNDTSKLIDLGKAKLTNISDILVLANIERPSANCDAQIIFIDEKGEQIYMSEEMPLALRSRINNEVSIKANIKGTNIHSPVIYPGVQIVLGNIRKSATYISRSIPCGVNSKVNISFDALLPSGSNIKVEIKNSANKWQEVDLTGSESIGENWEEKKYVMEHFTTDFTKVRLTLLGDAGCRPRVRALKIISTKS